MHLNSHTQLLYISTLTHSCYLNSHTRLFYISTRTYISQLSHTAVMHLNSHTQLFYISTRTYISQLLHTAVISTLTHGCFISQLAHIYLNSHTQLPCSTMSCSCHAGSSVTSDRKVPVSYKSYEKMKVYAQSRRDMIETECTEDVGDRGICSHRSRKKHERIATVNTRDNQSV
jgi:hypothetical protein